MMQVKIVRTAVVATSFWLGSSPALTHHSDAGRFDETLITIEATAVAFRLTNPHSMILVEVAGESGELVIWHVESFGTVQALARFSACLCLSVPTGACWPSAVSKGGQQCL